MLLKYIKTQTTEKILHKLRFSWDDTTQSKGRHTHTFERAKF